jgi:hypothetical protein
MKSMWGCFAVVVGGWLGVESPFITAEIPHYFRLSGWLLACDIYCAPIYVPISYIWLIQINMIHSEIILKY